jgi:tRNA pseudouridine32 synthase/23S rRNA pseudouridine746 synthase
MWPFPLQRGHHGGRYRQLVAISSRITLRRPTNQPAEAALRDRPDAMTPLTTLYADNRMVAVSKPAGQATAPGGGIEDGASLQEQVAADIGDRAFLVHRLDRDTSGVIVFAKDAATHRRLSLAFQGREVAKTYLALVHGHMDAMSGEIGEPLRTFGSGRVGVDPRGKDAVTGYSVKERLADVDLLEVTPLTGRRHQIRVHLYAIGHPVLGDTRYGDPRPVGGASRLMLHAVELTVPNAEGPPLVVRSEPPPDFLEILDAHR